jgi:MFS family permease
VEGGTPPPHPKGENLSMNEKVTPLKRLTTALVISNSGLYMAILTPIIVLLTIKLQAVAPKNLTSVFGNITGIGALVALFMNPISGWIGDRTRLAFGRRRTWMLVGAIGLTAVLIGIGFSESVLMIGVLWCFAQAFFNMFLSSSSALVADQVAEEKRGGISGGVGMSIYIGELLGMGFVNLFSHGSQSLQWSTVAILGLLTGIVAVIMIKEGKFTGVLNKGEKQPFSLRRIIPSPRKYPNFAWAFVARFLVLLGAASTLYNSVFLTQKFHYSASVMTQKVLVLTLITAVTMIIFSFFGGYLSDKFLKQKPFVIIAGVVMALGLALMAFSGTFAMFAIANGLMGIGTGMYYAVDLALVTRVLPNPEDTAKDLGLINIANALPQSIIPFIAPFFIHMGGYTLLYTVLAIIGMIGAFAVLPIPEIKKNDNSKNNLIA